MMKVEKDDSIFEDDDVSVAMEEDSEFGGSSNLDGNETSKKEPQDQIGQKESRVVMLVRLLVALLLIGITAGVAVAVYFYVKNSEDALFEDDFQDSSDKLLEAVGSVFDQTMGAIDSLMVSLVTHQEYANMTWPFVTIPGFGVRASKILSLGRIQTVIVIARVLGNQREAWENYTATHNAWVDESTKLQIQNPEFFQGRGDPSKIRRPPVITGFAKNGTAPRAPSDKYYVTWQGAPLLPNWFAYNWDFYQKDFAQFEEIEKNRVVAMGSTRDVFQPPEASFPLRYPIVAGAGDTVSPAQADPDKHPVVGALATLVVWRRLLENILSPGSEGLVVVFGNACNTTLTYQVNGPTVEFLGYGDHHDPKYNDMERSSFLHDLGLFSTQGRQYSGFPLSKDFCPYWMRLYPSDTMKDEHETNNPIIFCIVAVSIFVFTSAFFLVYDCVSERRQKKVLQVAVQSTAVVTNLFPKVVRDRIFSTADSQQGKKSKDRRIETAKLRLQHFLRSDEEVAGTETTTLTQSPRGSSDAPIAELFSDTTVMFCDISGFTAWSSVREPAQVFMLLETLYGAYDRLASRRGVFKVETIGDSYVAVVGLPEPRTDHAVVMAKFARDVREKTAELVKDLGRTLGPDTADLEIRIGLNSGPVTAGVLRGERSRFQLFGDTVNTASRMESTGVSSKIQISASTATLLQDAGKRHWVSEREGRVEAKGKGHIQTYWAEPTGRQSSSSAGTTDRDGDDAEFQMMDEKTRHLVDWNEEILEKLLKQIVCRREAQQTLGRRQNKADKQDSSPEQAIQAVTILEEVKEVIILPEYDPALAQKTKAFAAVELSELVQMQLREYISLIATMYRNNAFHSFEHASHVTMSVVKLLSRIVAPNDHVVQTAEETHGGLESTLHDHTYGITSDPLTQFACVFAALIHDVDHPGIPNAQMIKEDSPLVSLYKGKSLAEQNSVDISWRLLMDDQFEDLRGIIWSTKAEMARFRQLVVNAVMATDILDKDLKQLRNDRWDRAFSEGSRLGESMAVNVNRKATIVIEHLIQASDVAHTMQHWHIFRKWNERLFAEMYTAYREGRAEKNPAEFWYKGEIGFFDFYIIPLARKLSDCGVFGVASDEYLSYAMKNREEWENRGQEIVEGMIAEFGIREDARTAPISANEPQVLGAATTNSQTQSS